MEGEVYNVEIKGIRPLLMHSAAAIGTKTDGRGKTEYDPKEEAESYLYKNKDGEIVIPSLNLLSAMRESAKDFKVPGKGRKTFMKYIYAGVQISPLEIPLLSDGWEIDRKPVVIQRARIMRSRPRFDKWGVKFNIEIVDPIIRGSDAKAILEAAGKYQGLCDFRPLYGLFSVVGFERE